MTMTLQEALAEVKITAGLGPWNTSSKAISTILNAVVSGDLIPKSDADLAERRLAKVMEGLRLIELIGYREAEEIGWINAHMRGVATDVLSGKSIDYYWRFFPQHRQCPDPAILKEIDNG